jgi:hypothetical protein
LDVVPGPRLEGLLLDSIFFFFGGV